MSIESAAAAVAGRVRESRRGFLTVTRDALRDDFAIGRFTQQQSDLLCEALEKHGVFVHPRPFNGPPTVRLYLRGHVLAEVAESVINPESIPDSPLRRAAEVFARIHAGTHLRSDDVTWLSAFDLLLQVVLGRPPEGWEDLNDDRHPSQLARELAHALGLAAGISDHASTLRVAAAVCALRPRGRRWTSAELMAPGVSESGAAAFVSAVRSAHVALQTEHENLLRRAAQLLLAKDEVPTHPVELGLLGLRFRREEAEGSEP